MTRKSFASLMRLTLAFGLVGSQPAAAVGGGLSDSMVVGDWLAQTQDGVFRVEPCGESLCGRLVGMVYDGSVPKDVLGRSQCDLTMMTGFEPYENDRWRGKIFDPDSGKIYDALIWTPSPNVMKLRGYVLDVPLLGRTQTWTRFHGRIGDQCKMLGKVGQASGN